MVSSEETRDVCYLTKLRFELDSGSDDHIVYVTSKGNAHLPEKSEVGSGD